MYRRRIEQALSLLNPQYESVLEIGYGSGILMPSLVLIGRKVYGIDIESQPTTVAANLEKLGVHVSLSKGDILTADYPEGSFNLIIAISVFEHIRDLEPAINKVFHLLRPRGHFLVGMPRVDNLMRIAFPLIGYHDIKTHHMSDWHRFLKATGKLFHLVKFAKIPSWTPAFMGLYFNILLCKTSRLPR